MKLAFEKLTKRIDQLLSEKEHVVVGISGFGGAGKTSLAERVKNHFSSADWLQLDNFIINHAEGTGWDGGYDWNRFESVLKDVHDGKDFHYQWYHWEKDDFGGWIDEPLPRLVVVEGIRLLQPRLLPYFDVSVWIDLPLEEATKQGMARDKKNGNNEKHLAKWGSVWVPKDKEYADLFQPKQIADVLYSE